MQPHLSAPRCRARPRRRRRCRARPHRPDGSSPSGRPSRAPRGRRLGEGRIEEAARRRGGEPERMLGVGLLDDLPVVGQLRHGVRPAPRGSGLRNGTFGQSGLKRNLPSGQAKPSSSARSRSPAGSRSSASPRARPSVPQPECRSVQSISSRGVMAKPGCSAPRRSRQRADHLVVGAAFAGRLDQLRPEQNVLVAAALVDVVVLEEHGRRQHDVGHRARSRS